MNPPERIRTAADLRDIAEQLGRTAEVEQDFLLVRIAAQLPS